ncbi:alpha/beta fold hydrolase [Priestia abyssalis]|uniref:alpha/beta fold hydrolase n=1 Tax=Priestia abyssalis TaxID=1221450 RepID=UPI000995858A|nr:alpha/beta hydrolase [Priestia abyssalis]
MTQIPLLLLPGTLCDTQMWEYQITELGDIAACAVMKLEQDSIQGMARSVLEQAPEKFALAGFSMGGIVAIEVMRQAPDRVLKLALMDTNPNPPREEQMNGWKTFIQMARDGQFSDITPKHLLPNMIHPDCYDHKEIVSAIIEMAENVGKETMIQQMTALMNRPDGREVLPGITCPTLLLTGRQDVLCTVDMHEKMQEMIQNSQLAIIENSGHMTTLEQPEEVSRALRKWLVEN